MNWMDSNKSESKGSNEDSIALPEVAMETTDTQTEDNYIENNELFLRIKNLEKENMELRTQIKDLKRLMKETPTPPVESVKKSYINDSIRQSMSDN